MVTRAGLAEAGSFSLLSVARAGWLPNPAYQKVI
jgi:hypothetical protein